MRCKDREARSKKRQAIKDNKKSKWAGCAIVVAGPAERNMPIQSQMALAIRKALAHIGSRGIGKLLMVDRSRWSVCRYEATAAAACVASMHLDMAYMQQMWLEENTYVYVDVYVLDDIYVCVYMYVYIYI